MDRHKIAAKIRKGETPEGVVAHGNGYKTACTSSVLGFYGIDKTDFKYCQYVSDMVRIFNQNGFSAKRVDRRIVKNKVSNLGNLPDGFYLVSVKTHVALAYVTGGFSRFVVDTAPNHTRTEPLESIHKIGRLKK